MGHEVGKLAGVNDGKQYTAHLGGSASPSSSSSLSTPPRIRSADIDAPSANRSARERAAGAQAVPAAQIGPVEALQPKPGRSERG